MIKNYSLLIRVYLRFNKDLKLCGTQCYSVVKSSMIYIL